MSRRTKTVLYGAKLKFMRSKKYGKVVRLRQNREYTGDPLGTTRCWTFDMFGARKDAAAR